MFVTGLFALLVGLGVIPVVLLSAVGVPAWAAFAGWLLLCAVLHRWLRKKGAALFAAL